MRTHAHAHTHTHTHTHIHTHTHYFCVHLILWIAGLREHTPRFSEINLSIFNRKKQICILGRKQAASTRLAWRVKLNQLLSLKYEKNLVVVGQLQLAKLCFTEATVILQNVGISLHHCSIVIWMLFKKKAVAWILLGKPRTCLSN